MFSERPSSKKENAKPYSYVANFGVLGDPKQKLTTTKHIDFELGGVMPTFRDCGSPASELTSERSEEMTARGDAKYDSEADIEFLPSISRVADLKSGTSMNSSLSSDLNKFEATRHEGQGRVKDTFNSFYDAEDSEQPSKVALSVEPQAQSFVAGQSELGSSKPEASSSSLMKTIEALREENKLLRTKIDQNKKKPRRRSRSPAPVNKSPKPLSPIAKNEPISPFKQPPSPYKRPLTPPNPRGRHLSRPRTARRNPASTSRQGTARAYSSRSVGRDKSAVLRVRHCFTCDHLLSKGFSTVYCSKHGTKAKHDRSSSIDLLTQKS
jgi:hypothetical protein